MVGKSAVGFAHADAFQPADLSECEVGAIHIGKAANVHAPHDFHVRCFVHAQARLQQQVGGAARFAHAHGIKAGGELSTPDHRTAVVTNGFDGGVRDAHAGAKQQNGHGGDGHGNPLVVAQHHDGKIVLLDDRAFDI